MSHSLPLPVPPPSISLPAYLPPAHASLLTLGYVGSFYLSSTIRKLPKDDPCVMRSRLRVASGFTAVGWLGTAGLLWNSMRPAATHAAIKFPQLLLALGIPLPLSVPTFLTSAWIPLQPSIWEFAASHLLPAAILPLALTMTLFAGPLYVEWLDDCLPLPKLLSRARRTTSDKDSSLPRPSPWQKVKSWVSNYSNLLGLRNFVIGPATEEIIWRSSILSVYHYAGTGRKWLIFGTPLWFGIAHLHHAWETYRTRKANPSQSASALRFAVLQTSFQFTYTTLFGWYANFLFLRTGSILPPLLSHVFCNIMGFPNPASAAEYFPEKKTCK